MKCYQFKYTLYFVQRGIVPRKFKGTHFILPVIYWRKVRMTSSPHDPYELGYTRVTMAITKGSKSASWSESQKIVLVRIALCNSRA